MFAISRRQFLEQVIDNQTQSLSTSKSTEDLIFKKYANQKTHSFTRTTTTLSEYTGPWSQTQALQLIRRTMFGVKAGDLDTLSAMSMSDAVDYLLDNIPAPPSPPLNNYSVNGYNDPTGVPEGETWVNALLGDGNLNDFRKASYKSWWYGVLLNQNLSIQEKMVFFWHNHFSTQTYIVGDARLCYNHNVLLRANALGNFKTLASLITTDPAMLTYLNGYENTKNNPDENYAREFQELFTLGANNVSNYTEDDVKAASRIFTGWRINNTTLQSFFVPAQHDTSDKQFSSFYGNAVISGQSGAAGANETTEFINLVFAKTETAHYLCTKLYQFFVYYNIDADIDANIIAPLAQLLIDSNFEVKPVLQALLKSDHFYDTSNIGCYIRTPLDFLIGTLRTFGVSVPATTSVTDTYSLWNYLRAYGSALGLDLGDPPNVAGWQPFYQAPEYHEIWINSSTFPLRMSFTDMILSSGFDAGTSTTIAVNIALFTQQIPGAADPNSLINYYLTMSLGVGLSAAEQSNLKNILLSGQANDGYWSEAWTNYMADPNVENTNIVSSRLSSLLITMLRLPEHQLC